MAPCKPDRSDYFVAIFQVAEIWHVYSFCVKNVPVFSFSTMQKKWTKLRRVGVDFQERVWSLVFPLVENKTQGHFFTEKESASQISAGSEQLEKSLRNRHIYDNRREYLWSTHSACYTPANRLEMQEMAVLEGPDFKISRGGHAPGPP